MAFTPQEESDLKISEVFGDNIAPGTKFTIEGQSVTYQGTDKKYKAGTKKEDTNSKLPKSAPTKVKPEYPYLHETQDVNGKKTSVHANPNKPNESFESMFNHDGSFKTKEIAEKYKGLVTALAHEVRNYTSGGSSSQTDGHKDTAVGSTQNTNVKGGAAEGVGKEKLAGAQKTISGSAEGSYVTDANGNSYKDSKGDLVTSHKGSYFSSLEGDNINQTTGSKVDIINGGEYQVHVQGGNFDARVESGKLQIYSGSDMIVNTAASMTTKSLGEMLIESQYQITIKVGGSSIVIDTGSITIKSPSIKFEQGT